MFRKNLFVFLPLYFLFSPVYNAQTYEFTQLPASLPMPSNIANIPALFEGDAEYGDLDNDGDLDIVLAGSSEIGMISKIFINQNGSFYDSDNTTFLDSLAFSVTLGDIDGDSDLDILLNGGGINSSCISRIYRNDGNLVFTQINTPQIPCFTDGTSDLADVDQDGDLDLFITGETGYQQYTSKLFINDGSGFFTEDLNSTFLPVYLSDVDIKDVDNDHDMDIILTGATNYYPNYADTTILYENDGTGIFTIASNTMQGVRYGNVEIVNMDNDSIPEIYITGTYYSNQSFVYKYDSVTQDYLELSGTNLPWVFFCDNSTLDFDGDGDMDIQVCGDQLSGGPKINKIYLNNGNGVFTAWNNDPFDGLDKGVVRIFDFDNDGDLDLYSYGRNENNIYVTKMYLRNNSGNYDEITGCDLQDLYQSSIVSGDIDGDNDIDLIVNGYNEFDQPKAGIYKNNGDNTFVQSSNFFAAAEGGFELGDLDNDGDLDLARSGITHTLSISADIYINNGSGNLQPMSNCPLSSFINGEILFLDADNNGFLDIIQTGSFSTNTKYFINNGSLTFTEISNHPFPGVQNGHAIYSDVDGDNDQDVFLFGQSSTGLISNLYFNDGSGSYSLSQNSSFTPIYHGDAEFSDIDGDNDPDLLITGSTSSQGIFKIYLNDGNGSFTELTSPSTQNFIGVFKSDIEINDIDKDNDPDILITGFIHGNGQIKGPFLYINEGNHEFSLVKPFVNLNNGEAIIRDLNNDSIPEILLTGKSIDGPKTILYSSNICNLNANFTTTDLGNASYQFDNTSNISSTEIQWNFGDGSTSDQNNIFHTYSNNGLYNVILNVVDTTVTPIGSCSDQHIEVLNVTDAINSLQCNSSFIAFPDSNSNNVTVVNTSIGSNLSYFWDFGDGSTSTLQFPNHTYSGNGPYLLCLTVNDGIGCTDTYCDSIGPNGHVFKQTGFSINVTEPIGTSTEEMHQVDLHVALSPNPTNRFVTVFSNLDIQSLAVFNLQGKRVKNISTHNNTIDLINVASGYYFIQVQFENNYYILPFIKQ